MLLPGAVLGHQAAVLRACSPHSAGHRAHVLESRIVTIVANRKSFLPCLPHKKFLFHTLFLTCLVEFIYLFYGHASYKLWHGKKARNFFVLFLVWGRGGWEGVCGSFSDLELKENALINPGGSLGCRSEKLQL